MLQRASKIIRMTSSEPFSTNPAIESSTSTARPDDSAPSEPTGNRWLEKVDDADPFAHYRLAVKANIAAAGFIMSAGSPALNTGIQEADAPVVAALKNVGAHVVGTTNMHELAFGITSENAHFGAVELPGKPEHSAGGSSGGAAAVIAAGEADLSLGTDTGGSVTIPASHCGVFGFRPSTGRWSTASSVGLSWTRDAPGIFAKSAQLLAVADEAVTGDQPIVQKNIGVGIPVQYLENLDPHTRSSFEKGLELISSVVSGGHIDYQPVLELTHAAAMPSVLYESHRLLATAAAQAMNLSPEEAFARLSQEVASPDVAAILQAELDSPVTAEEYARAQQLILQARRANQELMDQEQLDALIFPATPAPAPLIGAGDVVEHEGQSVSLFELMTRHTEAGTILGVPMVTVPLPVQGLPVGLTIQGRRFRDADVLGIAQKISEALA